MTDLLSSRTGVHRIDVHHHALPTSVGAMLAERGAPNPCPGWCVNRTIEVMDANGIELGVVSNAIPAEIFPTASEADDFTRRTNEAVADLVRERPGRFGLFAALPMPHLDEALEALRHNLDVLGADGVTLLPHAGDRYLGDPLFDPLFEELDRRAAVVLVHPLALPAGAAPGVPPVFADFLLDTTRAAVAMIRAGVPQRFPRVSIILSHAGGFAPYAATRLEAVAETAGTPAADVRDALRHFYYDLALSAPSAVPSLLSVADPSRILFGTDWCAASAEAVERGTRAFEAFPGLGAEEKAAIGRANALRLLPSVARRLSVAAR
ncbi:amidohydrolase family protein [Actinoallomurus sp. CA-142502]|uniref:amidohydrolase family protein n=1 Tax=Actinoallomurus sp. CA-142502 TaxID=3239885 RepID=UPI003D8AC340